jgi:hypothetical protein
MKAGEWQYICVANHQGKAEEDGKGAMQEVRLIPRGLDEVAIQSDALCLFDS